MVERSLPQRTPIVSVVIPTYNYANLLDETIGSVLNQNFKNFELIVVDDNSTDNTIEVVQKYLTDSRVIFKRNEKGLGVAGNWNRCLDLVKGKYIKFLCADDKLHQSILERYVQVMEDHPEVAIVSCQKQVFSASSSANIRLPVSGLHSGKDAILAMIKFDNFLGEPTLPMFRTAALRVGGFGNFKWIVDWEMWIRLLGTGNCYIIPEVLCYVRRHGQQETVRIKNTRIREIEEYYLFKDLAMGVYGAFNEGQNIIRLGVTKKALICAREMYKLLPAIANKKSRTTIRSLYKIAFGENVILHWRLLPLLVTDFTIRIRRRLKRRRWQHAEATIAL